MQKRDLYLRPPLTSNRGSVTETYMLEIETSTVKDGNKVVLVFFSILISNSIPDSSSKLSGIPDSGPKLSGIPDSSGGGGFTLFFYVNNIIQMRNLSVQEKFQLCFYGYGRKIQRSGTLHSQ